MTEQPKHARDMMPAEYAAKLAELRRGQPPSAPPSPEKHARDMSASEKSEWLAAHRRKFQ